MQRLQELDDRVLVVFRKTAKRHTGNLRFACMSQYCFPHGCVQAVVAEWVLVGDSPQFSRDELRVACEEAWGTRRLVHVKGLTIGVARSARDVVELQVSVCRHVNQTVDRFQARLWQVVACKIGGEYGLKPGATNAPKLEM